jgi:hypothetical protein
MSVMLTLKKVPSYITVLSKLKHNKNTIHLLPRKIRKYQIFNRKTIMLRFSKSNIWPILKMDAVTVASKSLYIRRNIKKNSEIQQFVECLTHINHRYHKDHCIFKPQSVYN